MTQPHELDHLIARLAGESIDHPRQKIIRWLCDNGHEGDTTRFNQLYEEARTRYEGDLRTRKDSFATYEAFGRLFGQPGDPTIDGWWHDAVTRRTQPA